MLNHKLTTVSTICMLMVCGLFALLWHQLFYSQTNALPSALVGEPAPIFELPQLKINSANKSFSTSSHLFSKKDLQGKIVLLNFWATWCEACQREHSMLMKINSEYHIPIYSILYKDRIDHAETYLTLNGNPYVMTGIDEIGETAINFGIYGTPETFLMNASGEIVYRHVGSIDQASWEQILYPLIKKLQETK